MSEQEHDPGGESILDNPEAPYDGTPYATDYNIQAAVHNCNLIVRQHVDGLAAALYMGELTEEEVAREYELGIYNYVFLYDEDDPNRYLAVSLVEGQGVQQTWLTRAEMRTWHPLNNRERNTADG